MITVSWPLMLLLIPVPWFVRYLLLPAKTANASLRIPFFNRIDTLPIQPLQPRSFSQNSKIRVVIWLLLIISAVRPQWLEQQSNAPISGRDLILAIDISASMNFPDLADDQQQSRLALVKEIAGEFIGQRQGDRLGLVLFASQAYRQTPLTFDLHAVQQLLAEAEIGLAGRETAIGDAIALVVKQLHESTALPQSYDNKLAAIGAFPVQNTAQSAPAQILILLSDGANNSGQLDPIVAAKMAAKQQLRIYTVGLGADKMLARTAQGVREVNPARDLDESLLKEIATITGGRYFRAKSRADLSALYQQVEQLEPSIQLSQHLSSTRELFHWPLALALLLSAYAALSYLPRQNVTIAALNKTATDRGSK